jgi:hypothetical protein
MRRKLGGLYITLFKAGKTKVANNHNNGSIKKKKKKREFTVRVMLVLL